MIKESFFDRQENLRRVTRRLLFLTVVGSIGVGSIGGIAAGLAKYQVDVSYGYQPAMADIAPWALLGAVTTLAISIVVVFWRLLRLHFSRTAVRRFFQARELNIDERGSLTGDSLELVNVVDEMSIAATVPMPRVFLLENDQSINSFALVQRGEQSIIGVTAGALVQLSRDELQALIAHEIGHIANGDANINIRLLALIQGFRGIYDISVAIIGWPYRTFDNVKTAFFIAAYLTIMFGAFFIIGMFGTGVARIMQAAIARRREYLADASSVQYTRYPASLAAALVKADKFRQSRKHQPTKVAAFMMFVSPYRARSWLFRTHPTIEDRLEAVEEMTPGTVEDRDVDSGTVDRG